MKLLAVRIQNFRSILDSQEFDVADITCLVGKNESGKTSILKCLEHINSTNAKVPESFNADLDWPRNNEEEPTTDSVIMETSWLLGDQDIKAIEDELGEGVLASTEVRISHKFGGVSSWIVKLDDDKVYKGLSQRFGLDAAQEKHIRKKEFKELPKWLESSKPEDNKLKEVGGFIESWPDKSPTKVALNILYKTRRPKFLYFESYDRMSGRIAIDQMTQRIAEGKPLDRSQELFLAFLNYAGVELTDLKELKTTESYFNKLERAQNKITRQFFNYWRQNDKLEVRFDIQQARSQDPEPYNKGQVFSTRIYNALHKATVQFDERSAGFTWFFSFLVQFNEIKKKYDDVIILLDEPGMSLHGKAQADLLRFIEEQLKPHHQVIYTTHSPFMVPAGNLERVRVVEDVINEDKRAEGTRVSKDILHTSADTIFPLQAALGYELSQSLFIGPNVLLVEGPSDVLYLQTMSEELRRLNRTSLNPKWTLTPTGGVDKISAFASLFAGNKINIAVFSDFTKGKGGNKSGIENLKKSEILKATQVYSVIDFTAGDEGDIEDMFGDEAYIALINATYGLTPPLKSSDLASHVESARILKRIESWSHTQGQHVPNISHFTPSLWLLNNPGFLTQNPPLFDVSLDRFEELFKQLNSLLA